MKAPLDFIGVNLYYRAIVSAPRPWSGSHTRSSGCSRQKWLARARSEDRLGWEIWPQALYDMVTHITRDSTSVIEITESGCAYNDARTRMVRFATRAHRLSLAISASPRAGHRDGATFAAIMRGV